ncbi:MAG: AtpZ/AtpI family protein [Anaerolineae bacterium]|nr:AtpZ/AtpI family protein [Anaerolineae bacterium]
MQPKLALRLTRLATPHHTAIHAVIGEPGLSGIIIVLLVIGAGLLLDFLIVDVHPLFSVALSILSVPVALYWTLYRTQRMNDRRPSNTDYMRNLALATVAGQAGCTTVILVFLALFAGMYLDSRLDTHPVFTIGLILAAIPISLYSMIRLMLSSVAAIKHPAAADDSRATDAHHDADKENGS